MYVKKLEGPRAVTLPDGSVMRRSDLPDPKTRRWVVSRKAAVVRAVLYGLLSREQACELYDLSDEELSEWIRSAALGGMSALKATVLCRAQEQSHQ